MDYIRDFYRVGVGMKIMCVLGTQKEKKHLMQLITHNVKSAQQKTKMITFFSLYKAWFSWYIKPLMTQKNAGLDPNADKHKTLSLVGVNKQAEVRTPGRQSRKGKVNLARCRQKQQKTDTVQSLQYTEWLTRFHLDGLFCVHTLFAAWVLPEMALLIWSENQRPICLVALRYSPNSSASLHE